MESKIVDSLVTDHDRSGLQCDLQPKEPRGSRPTMRRCHEREKLGHVALDLREHLVQHWLWKRSVLIEETYSYGSSPSVSTTDAHFL